MYGFPPIAQNNCAVLILGSFPSLESRRLKQYYAHPQNSFWKIMFSLFHEPYTLDYEEKKALLLRNRIALWDVLYSHEGNGSADKNIQNPVPNQFPQFFRQYPRISHIFFNGSTCEDLFFRLADKQFLPESVQFRRLYSTSPANARYRLEEKLENWRQITDALSL